MTKETLIEKLTALQTTEDPEGAHEEADELLLDYIMDAEVRHAYSQIPKWYA